MEWSLPFNKKKFLDIKLSQKYFYLKLLKSMLDIEK